MLNDFSIEYSDRSDDELLLLACDRDSLTAEAGAALDAELHRRNLTVSDQVKYQDFVKRNEGREVRTRLFRTTSFQTNWNRLRVISNVVLDTLIAVLGSAALESSIPRLVPHSGAQVIWRAWIMSIVIASLLGVLATRYRASKTGVWAWLIPAGVFVFSALLYAFSRSTGFATHFSGYDCATRLEKSDCNEFFIVTVPFIRGVAYSIAALSTLQIIARLKKRKHEAV